MSYHLHTAAALDALRGMPDGSVQAVVTSPPYWNLRDYGAEGQIGLEATPRAHVEKLAEVFDECRRVLHRTGTLWVNYGDCWAGSSKHQQEDFNERWHGKRFSTTKQQDTNRVRPGRSPSPNYRAGNLIECSSMLAEELRARGWIFRSRIIWAKGASCNPNWVGNPMPESVAGWFDRVDALTGEVKAVRQGFRPAQAHEYVLLFAKGPQSYGDSEAVKEASSVKTDLTHKPRKVNPKSTGTDPGEHRQNSGYAARMAGMVGTRNLRSVWAINPRPFPEAHFATYPQELAELCIRAATPAGGCCRICGAPTVRVQRVGAPDEAHQRACGKPMKTPAGWDTGPGAHGSSKQGRYSEARAQEPTDVKARVLDGLREKTTIGWRMSCSCFGTPVPGEPVHPDAFAQMIRPAVVLDPFAGSGTTLRAALQLGREAVGIEISPEFAAMAERLTAEFAARGIQKPLFEECA